MTNGGGRVLPLRILIRTFVCAAGAHRPDVRGEIKYNQKHYDYGNFNTEVCEPAVGLGVQGAVLRPEEQAGSDRAAERVPPAGKAGVRPGVRLHGVAGRDPIEQGVARGPALYGRGGWGVHRGGPAERPTTLLPPLRVLRVADLRPRVGEGRRAALRPSAGLPDRADGSGLRLRSDRRRVGGALHGPLHLPRKGERPGGGRDNFDYICRVVPVREAQLRGVPDGRGAVVLDAEEHGADGAGSGERRHADASGAGAPAGVWAAGFGTEKRAKYDADMITERDMYNILETAKEEGFSEGEAKGKAEVARKMLAAGMPAEQITEFTGLTAEQLAALK